MTRPAICMVGESEYLAFGVMWDYVSKLVGIGGCRLRVTQTTTQLAAVNAKKITP